MSISEAPTKLQCAATKANGHQCGAYAVRGHTQCAGHLGLGISTDPTGYQAKGAHARRELREAKKLGLTTILELKLARDADQIAENWARESALDWRAAEGALTRLYGKPKETLEVSGGLDLTALSRDERDALVRKALEEPAIVDALPESYRVKLAALGI